MAIARRTNDIVAFGIGFAGCTGTPRCRRQGRRGVRLLHGAETELLGRAASICRA